MVVTRRKVVANLFFLLAVLITFYAVAHFYLEWKYPASVEYVERNLASPTIAEQFKVEEAKKSGYSENEIAKYLAEKNSETFEKLTHTIFLVELTTFIVALLVGVGIIILKLGAKKSE